MAQQLGFGFGKGRRVITTISAGETVTRARARQQRWGEQPVTLDARQTYTSRDLIDALQRARRARRQQRPFRMAKARLRSWTR